MPAVYSVIALTLLETLHPGNLDMKIDLAGPPTVKLPEPAFYLM